MRDPYRKKQRDLRRIARSGSYNPSIFDLFDKYHPEIKKRYEELRFEYQKSRFWYWMSPDYNNYNNCQNDWATKIAGSWNAIGGSSGYYREGRRAREKQALRRAFLDDDWDDFFIPHERQEWD